MTGGDIFYAIGQNLCERVAISKSEVPSDGVGRFFFTIACIRGNRGERKETKRCILACRLAGLSFASTYRPQGRFRAARYRSTSRPHARGFRPTRGGQLARDR